MASPTEYDRLTKRIERAQRKFQIDALVKLHPELRGETLARAVAREAMLDATFTRNMRTRVRTGLRRIYSDPTVSGEQRARRIKVLESNERRYLVQHIAAASQRMVHEATWSRLVESGAEFAYWLMDFTKRTHTPDCLAMEGKVWPMSVLDPRTGVNPSNRHAGCGCRLISVQEARARGLALRRGYRPASSLREAGIPKGFGRIDAKRGIIRVPIRPGARGGLVSVRTYTRRRKGKVETVRAHTRHLVISGVVSPELEGGLERYLDSVEGGKIADMQGQMADLIAGARKLYDLDERDESLRTLSRVHAAAMNPEGVRVRMGRQVRIDPKNPSRLFPVPIPIQEPEGVVDPWGADGTYRWIIPPDALGNDRQKLIQTLDDSGAFEFDETDDGTEVWTKPHLRAPIARSRARHAEIIASPMRRLRIVEAGLAFDNDDPLDKGDDEADIDWDDRDENNYESRFAGVPHTWIGDAAEAIVSAATERLKELDIIGDNATMEWASVRRADRNAPLDWVAVTPDDPQRSFGIEVKGESMRGWVPSATPESGLDIRGRDRARKLAEQVARGVRPALATVFVDADHDVAHMFLMPYTEDKNAYKGARVPLGLRDALLDGSIRPGDTAMASRGTKLDENARTTVFVGTFRLPYNPLKAGEDARPSTTRLQLLAKTGGGAFDVGPSKEPRNLSLKSMTIGPGESRTAFEREGRDERLVDLFTKQNLSLQAIASEVEMSPTGVRAALVRLLGKKKYASLSGGSGARKDLGPDRKRAIAPGEMRQEIVRLADEGVAPNEIARRLKLGVPFVKSVVEKRGARPKRAALPPPPPEEITPEPEDATPASIPAETPGLSRRERRQAREVAELHDHAGISFEELDSVLGLEDGEAELLYRLVKSGKVAESAVRTPSSEPALVGN